MFHQFPSSPGGVADPPPSSGGVTEPPPPSEGVPEPPLPDPPVVLLIFLRFNCGFTVNTLLLRMFTVSFRL